MKVMLAIDIDDNTEIEDYDIRVWCYNKTTGLEKWYQNVPVKPMPKRIPTNEYGYMTPYGSVWNACIDKILGEENE